LNGPEERELEQARKIAEIITLSIPRVCRGVTNLYIMPFWYADIGPYPERSIKLKYSEVPLNVIRHY